jgi:hypothetical protein
MTKTKTFTVEATITVRKQYTVVAADESEAIEKLTESGIVTAANEDDRDEDYEEEFEVLGESETENPDVD